MGSGRPWPAGGACDIGAYELDHQLIGLAASVSPNSGVAMDTLLTYTVTLSATPVAATFYLTDTLPSGVSFAGWRARPAGAAIVNGTLTWSGRLTGPAGLTISFTALREGGRGTLTSHATASGGGVTAQANASFSSVGYPLYVDARAKGDDGFDVGQGLQLAQRGSGRRHIRQRVMGG